MKPEETQRDPESWYGRIKSGQIKCCPVEGCGGNLVHNDMVTWYECQTCEWNDEFQDLQDMGYQEPTKGWPLKTRTCVICGAANNGTTMPMIELASCLKHPAGHCICRWKLDGAGHVIECECSKGLVDTSKFKKCPLDDSLAHLRC